MRKLIEKEGVRDPYIIKHNNKYYRCFSDMSAIFMSCADTIEGLRSSENKKVYEPEENKEYSKELWAPELHIII